MFLLITVQTCISTLATRHLAIGRCSLYDLDQLRAPMDDVLGALEAQLLELQKYKARFGELDEGSNNTSVANIRKKSARQSSRASRQSKLDSQSTNGA